MSEYAVVIMAPEFNDEPLLKKSLDEMGASYTEHQQPVSIRPDKCCDRAKAHIIVNKLGDTDTTNSHRPFGFMKSNEGIRLVKSGAISTKFMNKLRQTYAKHKVIQKARKMGFTLASQKTSDGKVRLRMTRLS